MPLELAEKVSHVPDTYNKGNKSTARLLKEAGFPANRRALSVDEVEDVLRREPGLADLWFKRGTDQRIVGGWGIEKEGGEYRVQSYSDGQCVHCQDRCRACAEFVVRYVTHIGDVLERTH